MRVIFLIKKEVDFYDIWYAYGKPTTWWCFNADFDVNRTFKFLDGQKEDYIIAFCGGYIQAELEEALPDWTCYD